MGKTSREHHKERECSDPEIKEVKKDVRLRLAQVDWNCPLLCVKWQEDTTDESSAKHHYEHIGLADNHVC
jgi:hypothetical protein